MPYEKDPMVKMFSLWENRGKDGTKRFWSGIVGGVKFLMFRSQSNHPQAPMFDVYVAPFRKDKKQAAGNAPADADDYKVGTPGEKPTEEKPQEAQAPAANPGDEELPF